MNEQLKLFYRDNPNAAKVKGSKYEDILRWANRRGYITLTKFMGMWWYDTKTHVDMAVAALDNRGETPQAPHGITVTGVFPAGTDQRDLHAGAHGECIIIGHNFYTWDGALDKWIDTGACLVGEQGQPGEVGHD